MSLECKGDTSRWIIVNSDIHIIILEIIILVIIIIIIIIIKRIFKRINTSTVIVVTNVCPDT